MRFQNQPHWNNFSVPELREILQHCRALEQLGIAQDEEMMSSIETDLVLREEKTFRKAKHSTLTQKHAETTIIPELLIQ